MPPLPEPVNQRPKSAATEVLNDNAADDSGKLLSAEVTIESLIRKTVAEAIRQQLPSLLAEALQRTRLRPIDDLPVSERTLRDAQKRGEIRIYKRGQFVAVDEDEFAAWVKRNPLQIAKPQAPPLDELSNEAAELIAFHEHRRRKREHS